ncbi:hypothetical protein [Streptomyces xiamenensis]|uniref:hypothetical protein n=1 Tax=Streptomyces xiamenensis TaxID=408015 RepID=UPI0035DA197A
MTKPEVIVDTETLGLDPTIHPIWEIAASTPDRVEYLWQIRPTEEQLAHADPIALEINRYHERMQVPPWALAVDMLHPDGPSPIDPCEIDAILRRILNKARLLGSNPDFDARFIQARLGDAVWYHRHKDVPTLAEGFLYGQAHTLSTRALSARTTSPYATVHAQIASHSSYAISAALGVAPPSEGEAHTALGDVRWIRRLNDAITTEPTTPPAGAHSLTTASTVPAPGRR